MNEQANQNEFNFDYVESIARIAAYDDLKSAPRITTIEPNETNQFIMDMAVKTYEQAKLMGGNIPFSIIKEVSENFIHARFSEITISILDHGDTIRFADQGPGIKDKEKVKLPGYTSAIEPMKQYIRGVGSGLPIVKDYFDEKNGSVTIDDNVLSGAVVTISLNSTEKDIAEEIPQQLPYFDNTVNKSMLEKQQGTQRVPIMVGTNGRVPMYIPPTSVISERGKKCLEVLYSEGAMGVNDIAKLTEIPPSSTFNELKKLEEAGLITKVEHKARELTQMGLDMMKSL